MKERKIDAVLFDFDGTILNSLPGWMIVIDSHLRELEKSYELTKPLPQNHREIMKTLAAELMSIQEYGIEEADAITFVNSIIAGSVQSLSQASLHNGMQDLLIKLKEDDNKIGIVSSTKTDTIRSQLERLKIGKYFDSIVGRDRVSKTKPNPEPVLLCLDELDVVATRSIMVGDHHSDILAAKAAGILLPLLFFPDSHEEFYDPQEIDKNDHVVRTPAQLLSLIK